MRDANGNRVYRKIELKFITPDKTFEKIIHAPPRQAYTKESIDKFIEDEIIEKMDERWPYWNFRMVSLGVNKISFVYDGLRDHSINEHPRL